MSPCATDYRRIPRALSQTYFSPLNTATRREMQKLFEGVTAGTRQEARRQGAAPHDPVVRGRQLTIWGRKITVPESTSKVARFTFEELCGRPLSSADYIEITQTFGTIFVEEVARMGLSEKDMARRFITFVDACYESKVRIRRTWCDRPQRLIPDAHPGARPASSSLPRYPSLRSLAIRRRRRHRPPTAPITCDRSWTTSAWAWM